MFFSWNYKNYIALVEAKEVLKKRYPRNFKCKLAFLSNFLLEFSDTFLFHYPLSLIWTRHGE